MRINHGALTHTMLFRLARAVLPEALLLTLFGRRAPAAMSPRCDDVRRAIAARRFGQ